MSKYLESGVDISSADKLVEEIKQLAAETKNANVVSGIGGFGAVFDPFSSGQQYTSPLLVSSTDGVGTKLLIAQSANNHRSVGIDLVAMCVNDILAQGAKPLFFLDYFATGVLDNTVAAEVIKGIADGCRMADIALVGGETAEMPGMYSKGHYDLAGFAVGIVERSEVLPRLDKICPGDLIVGVASSGLHSNGFSLVRKVLQDAEVAYESTCPFDTQRSWADVLLDPTKIYTSSVLPSCHLIKAIAHITGGGLINNIPRVLPEGCAAKICSTSWPRHDIFTWLETTAKIPQKDMLETFNCGIGLALVSSATDAQILMTALEERGETAYIIGEIVPRTEADQAVVLT